MGDRRPGDAAAVVANSELARRELGWAPQRDDLDQIVADALAWERILTSKNSARGLSRPVLQPWARKLARRRAMNELRGGAWRRRAASSLWGMA